MLLLRNKYRPFLVLIFFALSAFGQIFTIDEAIEENMKYFSQRLPAGMQVVILNIESESRNLSNYIILESGTYAANNTQLSVLTDRARISNILQEKRIDDINLINETTALEIGRRLGVQSVISGSISRLGGNYRFRIQALNTADGSVLGMQSLNVRECEIFAELLGAQASQSIAATPETQTQNIQNIAAIPEAGIQGGQNIQSARDRLSEQSRIGNVQEAHTAPETARQREEAFDDLTQMRQRGGFGSEQSARERMQAQMRGNREPSLSETVAPPPSPATTPPLRPVSPATAVSPVQSREQQVQASNNNYFLLSVRFQRFADNYGADNSYSPFIYSAQTVSPGSLNLEIGGINGRRGFSVNGIFDLGPGNLGLGVFLGKTTLNYDVFRFRIGTDLGFWAVTTQALEESRVAGSSITYGRVRENLIFGGPSMAFLLGHNPVFVSFGLKFLFGLYYESDMYDWHRNGDRDYDGYPNFRGMPVWNIGLTFTL